MTRPALTVEVVPQLQFIHTNVTTIATHIKWQPPKNKMPVPVNESDPFFGLIPTLSIEDLEKSLWESPLLERVLQAPKSNQGGLQVIFAAGAGDKSLMDYADRLVKEDEILAANSHPRQIKMSPQLGFVLDGLEDTFDVRGFQVGTLRPVVLFSVKKPFSALNAKECHMLGYLLEKYWRGGESLHGLISPVSKEIQILRLAVMICDDKFSGITGDPKQSAFYLRDLMSKEDVNKELDFNDIKSALKLAVTLAAQEVMQNSADYIKQELEKCKNEMTVEKITQVIGFLTSLRSMQDSSQLWEIIGGIQRFLGELQVPNGIFSMFYTNFTAEFKGVLGQFQTCLALYAFNTGLQENRNVRNFRSLSGSVPSAFTRTDSPMEIEEQNTETESEIPPGNHSVSNILNNNNRYQ